MVTVQILKQAVIWIHALCSCSYNPFDVLPISGALGLFFNWICSCISWMAS